MENIAELQQLEESSVRSRRSALLMGGAALAGLALTRGARAQSATMDSAILNFALNLEYLEAQYYSLAVNGAPIDASLTASGDGVTAGGTVSYKTSPMVPFQSGSNVQAYATETAAEELNHVKYLRTALATGAVAMPNIDLMASFATLGSLIGVANFDPFASELNFLIGSFIFEDVGVSAYLGAAPLISSSAILGAALDIHAVEAYHAGSVRLQLFAAGTTAQTVTASIAALRQTLGGGFDVGVGVQTATVPAKSNNGASTVVDVDPTTSIVAGRTTSQVLSIVYGSSASGTTSGLFFPNGMNGTIK